MLKVNFHRITYKRAPIKFFEKKQRTDRELHYIVGGIASTSPCFSRLKRGPQNLRGAELTFESEDHSTFVGLPLQPLPTRFR